MHNRNRKTISVIVYSPAPMVKPRRAQDHRPTDVVSPLICPRELNKIELPDSIAVATMVDADSSGRPTGYAFIRNRSSIIALVDVNAIRTKVRRPAEWRLLERSQPIMDASKQPEKSSAGQSKGSTQSTTFPKMWQSGLM